MKHLWTWFLGAISLLAALAAFSRIATMPEAPQYIKNGALPSADGPNGLDTSVRFFPYFLDAGGAGIFPTGPRSQYQVTADATLTQIRGISFGATVATMEILSNLIRPASAAALYPSNRIT